MKHFFFIFFREFWKLWCLTLIVNGKHSAYQVLRGSESYRCQLWQMTEMLTLTVDRILVALKYTVDQNFNSCCWQDFANFESYGFQVQTSKDLGSSESYRQQKSHSSEDFGSSEPYNQQERQLPVLKEFWCLWKLWSTGMSKNYGCQLQ